LLVAVSMTAQAAAGAACRDEFDGLLHRGTVDGGQDGTDGAHDRAAHRHGPASLDCGHLRLHAVQLLFDVRRDLHQCLFGLNGVDGIVQFEERLPQKAVEVGIGVEFGHGGSSSDGPRA
jgi:hypothetical protein